MIYNVKSDINGTKSDFNYRKKLTINHSGALTSYQMKLVVDHVNTNMKTDFGDIRFNTEAGDYIPYWIEKQVNDISADLWIKTDLVDGNTIIYMYYGNNNLISESNSTNTFIREISGVVGAWNLNGDALDLSGNGNNGTLYGGMGYASGKFGQAGNFDGINDNIGGSSTNFPTGNVSATVTAWIKMNVVQSSSVPGIFAYGTEAANRLWGFGLQGSNLYFLGFTNDVSQAWAYSTGVWYFVCLTTNGRTVKWYINGNQIGSDATLGATPDIGSSGWVMGKQRPSNAVFFNGSISNVRLYNRTLSGDEINTLYGLDGERLGLVTLNYPGRELVRKYVAIEPTYTTFAEQTNQSYTYRLPIVIDNTTNNNTLTNYQVSITVDTSDINKFHNSAADIRFTSDTSSYNEQLWSVSYPYWIESISNPTTTKIWIKIDSIPANSTKTIYMYYGNPTATSASDGTNTFIFFDDFNGDLSKWNLVGSGISINGNKWLAIPGGGSWNVNGVASVASFNRSSIFEWDYYHGGTGDPVSMFGFGSYPLSYNPAVLLYPMKGVDYILEDNLVETHLAPVPSLSISTPDHFKLIIKPTGQTVYINNNAGISSSTNTMTTGNFMITTTYSGYQYFDNIRVRKYTTTEPTLSTPVSATGMTITPSETPCRVGLCTTTVNVTWAGTGSLEFTFVPSIKIDGIPIIPDPQLNPATVGPTRVVTQSFTVSGLIVGTHSICPDPN